MTEELTTTMKGYFNVEEQNEDQVHAGNGKKSHQVDQES